MSRGLQNRGTAWIITVVLVVVAILAGARSSLEELRRNTWDVFSGGGGDYYSSMEYDLTQLKEDGHNLVTVAGRYLAADDLMLGEMNKALGMMDSAYYPKEYRAAAEKLRVAAGELSEILTTKELDDTDKVYHTKLMANIQSRFSTIESNRYNDSAREFNAELTRFPAAFLANICGVEPLELYE